MSHSREPLALLALTVAAVAVSGIAPHHRLTWWLEVAPILIALPLLIATRRVFPLTPLLYRLLFLYALIMALGAHYTYARVPVGFWAQDWLDLGRNHYDRVAHVLQGVVPGMLAREILIRLSPLRPGAWLFVLVSCVALAVSAGYEFIEWWSALIWGGEAEAFLATQGDPWDTQWDMFLALCGAIVAQLLFNRSHDRQLRGLSPLPRHRV